MDEVIFNIYLKGIKKPFLFVGSAKDVVAFAVKLGAQKGTKTVKITRGN